MNVFDLYATLSLDTRSYDEGLSSAKNLAEEFRDTLIDIANAGIEAYTGLISESIESYGNYEQMTEGLKHLFGDDTADIIIDNAENAFKTAQMSASDYMFTATTFAGALMRSLGGESEEAARLIDVAMQDASDNVNMFGSNMNFVLRAYQGFARQEFRLLDNLRLGYGGTKKEARQLLYDAQELTQQYEEFSDVLLNLPETYDKNDFSMLTMDNVIKAIHVMQEYQDITGTAFREGETTIQGTIRRTQAAWDNLLTAFASGPDGMDMDKAIDNLFESIFGSGEGKGLLNVLIPRISQTIEGISDFLVRATPILAEKIPEMIEQLSPSIEKGVGSIITLITTILPSMINRLWPVIRTFLSTLWTSISENMHEEGGIFGLIASVVDWIIEHAEDIPGALAIAWASFKALDIAKDIMQFITMLTLLANRATLVVGAIGAIAAVIFLYRGELANFFGHIGAFIENVRLGFEEVRLVLENIDWLALGSYLTTQLMLGFANGINSGIGMIQDAINNVISEINNSLGGVLNLLGISGLGQVTLPTIDTTGLENNMAMFKDGILNLNGQADEVRAQLDTYNQKMDENAELLRTSWFDVGDDRSLSERAIDAFTGALDLTGLNFNLFDNIDITSQAEEAGAKAATGIETGFTNNITTLSTSGETAGQSIMTGVNTGMMNNMSLLSASSAQAGNEMSIGIQPTIGYAYTWGSDMMLNLISGINSQAGALEDTMVGVAGIMNSYIGFSEPEKGPLSDFHTYAPDMMNLFAQGIRDNQSMLLDTISDAFDFSNPISTQSVQAASGTSMGLNGWSINVYGSQGMNEVALAKKVANQVRDKVVSIGAL